MITESIHYPVAFDDRGEPNINQNRARQLAYTDDLPKPLRDLVNDYGFAIVARFIQYGITNPVAIEEIIKECWLGVRSPSQHRPMPTAFQQLEWMLASSGSCLSFKSFWLALRKNSYILMPVSPNSEMVEASMEAVKMSDGMMSKRKKHETRLRAAARAQAQRIDQLLGIARPI